MNFDLLDSNLLYVILGVIVAVLGVILAYYGLSTWVKSGNKITNRLDHFVGSEEFIQSNVIPNRIIPREISGSLFSRTIASWMKSFFNFIGRFTPERTLSDLEHKLAIAGFPMNLHAAQFYALRFLFLVAGVVLAWLINRDFKNINITSLLFGVAIIMVFMLLPNVWLNGLVRGKQDEIRRGLPDALDMLSVCASAGLGFDQSLQKISSYWETDLGREFKRVTHEMEMGVSRSVALKNMSDRMDVEDLSRFIAIIIQAEAMGMSYADVLHSQAAQMRVLRQYRAREIANKLPAKMIIPLALLIFPALIAVILGPIIPTIFGLF